MPRRKKSLPTLIKLGHCEPVRTLVWQSPIVFETMKNEILSLLPPGHPWGQHLILLDTVDSTNTYAKQLARSGAPEGTVVMARAQTGGRGRRGRSFSSPEGLGLYFSLILRPHCRPEALMHLTCAAGVAAANAVEKATGLRPGIKWTNDLVCGNRKLGGILTELSASPDTGLVDFAVIGIGINCLQRLEDFPEELQSMACSLLTETDRSCSPARLAACLMEDLQQMNTQLLSQKDSLMDAFVRNCITIGREISILRGDEVRHGTAIDIDADGGLLVAFPDGHRETVTSGEVSIRGMYGYL